MFIRIKMQQVYKIQVTKTYDGQSVIFMVHHDNVWKLVADLSEAVRDRHQRGTSMN